MVNRIIRSRNLRGKVYQVIRTYVISSEVAPGSKINEDALAKDLGVSKTPVREALSKLAHEGLIEIFPNRGSFKVKLSNEDLLEIMMIRESLEGLCVRLATKYINDKAIQKLRSLLDDFEEKDLLQNFSRYPEVHSKFHSIIHNMSKAPRLIRIITGMFELTHMLRLQYFDNLEKVSRSLKLHRELIDAMENGDEELADNIRKKTIQGAYESLLRGTL